MSDLSSRPPIKSIASKEWDVLVVGGGITGAGIMREVARRGKRVLLVEQGDYASGTSSRSSKIIHGGFHYLPRLQLRLVREAIHEREQMLGSGNGLAERLDFNLLTPRSYWPAWLIEFGLSAYDLLAGHFPKGHSINLERIRKIAPEIAIPSETAAFSYHEAAVDDAGLVLRVIMEGCRRGGTALNYVEACDPLLDPAGQVIGARLLDRETGCRVDLRARATINATGPWSDRLRMKIGARPRVRLVRGSHLVFPRTRLPLGDVIAVLHPDSQLPLYFIPWQGVTLVGSTNEEETGFNGPEVCIRADEVSYLLKAVQLLFPSARFTHDDILCTFSGLRPIVDHGQTDPAKASREDAIWSDSGMLTVAGGKLTTFRCMAVKTLQKLRERMPDLPAGNPNLPIVEPLPGELFKSNVHPKRQRLSRFGAEGVRAILASSPEGQKEIPGLGFSTAELRWVLQNEAVLHLDDLLLRRFRVGLTLPEGGLRSLENVRVAVQSELGWDDSRWEAEVAAYAGKYHRAHAVPEI